MHNFLQYVGFNRLVIGMMQKLFIFIIWGALIGMSLPTQAQVTSPLGRFQVDYVKGCSPLTVTVTDILGGPTAQYLYDADTCVTSSPKYDPSLCPPTSNTTNTSYTYTEPGTYSLVQVVASQIPRGDTITIEVLPDPPPEFQLTRCNNNSVHIFWLDTYYDQYLIDYGDGSPPTQSLTHTYAMGNVSYPVTVNGYFNNGPVNCGSVTLMVTPVTNLPPAVINRVEVISQSFTTGVLRLDYSLSPDVRYIIQVSENGTSNFTNIEIPSDTSTFFANLNTVDSVYCYRISATDRCNNTVVYSNTVCSTNIRVDAQDGQNEITWNTFVTPEFNQYEITKNGSPLPPINNGNVQMLADTEVECNALYCYRLVTDYTDGGQSVSVERCVLGINNSPPPKITTLTASVDNSSITVDWNLTAPINFYRIFRSENGGPFESIGDGTDLPYVDENLRPQLNRYCYYIIYQNACGFQSEPSEIACAINLQGQNSQNQFISLNWSPYSGWASGIMDYELEIMDENGMLIGPPISLGRTAMNYQDPIDPNRQISQYRIVAVSNDSIPLRSFSNIIEEDIPLQLHVPNSFTPNNDGLNDIFTAKGLFINEYTMEIYNRWGELLFHTSELDKGWDGFYKGSLSPEDTYVYMMEATDLLGRTTTKRGTVLLLRKNY